MTYNVFGGTLSLTQSINQSGALFRNVRVFRSIYVDGNSSSAALYISRSGYRHKQVIVTYVTHVTHPAASAAAADGGNSDNTVAGVRVYPAVEGIDFTRAVSSVVLSTDVVSIVNCPLHIDCGVFWFTFVCSFSALTLLVGSFDL